MVNAPENPSGVKYFSRRKLLFIENLYNSTPLGFVVCIAFVFYNNFTPLGFLLARLKKY
jgi:hypothetical protein